MKGLDIFIINTIRPFLIVFGIATGLSLPFAIDINLLTPMFGGLVDYTPSSVPALRHWGIMVFGIGALMAVAAFRPLVALRDHGVQRRRERLHGLLVHQQFWPAMG
jgi:hypothetical protein